MRLVISELALRNVESEHAQAYMVLSDKNASPEEKRAALELVTISPRGALELAVRCLEVKP